MARHQTTLTDDETDNLGEFTARIAGADGARDIAVSELRARMYTEQLDPARYAAERVAILEQHLRKVRDLVREHYPEAAPNFYPADGPRYA